MKKINISTIISILVFEQQEVQHYYISSQNPWVVKINQQRERHLFWWGFRNSRE
jgi:hypothetical protein